MNFLCAAIHNVEIHFQMIREVAKTALIYGMEWQIGRTHLYRRYGVALTAFIVGFVNVFNGTHHLFPCLRMSLCNRGAKEKEYRLSTNSNVEWTFRRMHASFCSVLFRTFKINHRNVHFHLKFEPKIRLSHFAFKLQTNVPMQTSDSNSFFVCVFCWTVRSFVI